MSGPVSPVGPSLLRWWPSDMERDGGADNAQGMWTYFTVTPTLSISLLSLYSMSAFLAAFSSEKPRLESDHQYLAVKRAEALRNSK